MKKFIAIFLAILIIIPFTVSCGEPEKRSETPNDKEPEITTYEDADYDGLYDDIDPAKNDNSYAFSFGYNKKQIESANFTRLTVDYRRFLQTDNPSFDVEIAKLACILVQETYGNDVTIKNSVYKNGYSEISPAMVQFGGRNVQKIRLYAKEYKYDKNDLATVTVSNHVLKSGGKTNQIFLVLVDGYVNQSGWSSNLDVGADTENYYDITGTHSEWKNKAHHKGFDVTASRLFPLIEKYVGENAVQGAETSLFITGHSRGGAIAELIAKAFTDKNVKTLAYCFNSPNTVAVPEGTAEESSYSNILNIINEDDVVPMIPFTCWNGFRRYGKDYFFKASEHAEEFYGLFGTEYSHLKGNEIENLKDKIYGVLSERESIYEFRSEPDIVYEGLDASQKEAVEKKISSWFSAGTAESKCIKTEVTEDGGIYRVEYYTRPALIVLAANAFFSGNVLGLSAYGEALSYYSNNFGEVISAFSEGSAAVSGDSAAFSVPHISETDIFGINFIKI